MGLKCILGGMKAWLAMLLLGIGACAEPPRRPPVTYVPIVRGPEAPPPSAGGIPAAALGAAPIPAEREGGTATSIVAVSTAEPPAAPDDSLCYLKLSTGCCADSTAKKQARSRACPKGFVAPKSCKGFGKTCK